MKRIPKKGWLVWVGAAAALIGAAVVAVPFLVPVRQYRPLLEQYLTSSTGRRVEIGSLRLSLWPRVHVHATDLRLLNPAGFPAGSAFEAGTVDLGLNPWALLARRLEIRTITITHVQATLLTDATGRTNYDVPARPSPEAGARPPISLAPIRTVSIRGVALAVRTVDLRRGRSAPVVGVTGLNVTVGLFQPAAADWTTRLNITADLKGARIVAPFLKTTLAVRSGTLALRAGTGAATFAMTLGSIAASGKVVITRLSPPRVTFVLVVPTLDLATLQRLTKNAAAGPGPPGPQPLIARGALDIGRLTAAPFEVAPVHSTVSIYGNRVRADAYQLSAYGGTVRGSALLEFAGRAFPASATAVVHGVNVEALLRAAAPRLPGSTGMLDATLSVSTALGGGDPEAAFAGHGTFVVRNGTLRGVNAPGRSAPTAKSTPISIPSGSVTFRSFGGDVRFARERVYSNALRLDAAAVRATAHGSVGFDQTLDYVGVGLLPLRSPSATLSPAALLSRLLLPQAAGATAASVSFSLRGTIGDPMFAPTGAPQFIHGGSPAHEQAPAAPGPRPTYRISRRTTTDVPADRLGRRRPRGTDAAPRPLPASADSRQPVRDSFRSSRIPFPAQMSSVPRVPSASRRTRPTISGSAMSYA